MTWHEIRWRKCPRGILQYTKCRYRGKVSGRPSDHCSSPQGIRKISELAEIDDSKLNINYNMLCVRGEE